jgi:Tfp pilus assembly protein PilN
MRLDLNLAREEDRPGGRWAAACWVGAALAIAAATTAQGLYYRSLARSTVPAEARLRALEAEARRLEAARAGEVPAETRGALAALPGQMTAYNEILAAAAFPWTGLLMELEASLPPNVGLTAIQPNPASGTVTLEGQARAFADLTAFISLLEQREPFREVQLLRHSEQTRGAAEAAGLQDFTLRLQYVPDGLRGEGSQG